MLINLKIVFAAIIFLALNFTVVAATQSLPTKAEFDQTMNNAAIQFNEKMVGKNIDGYTKFKSISYSARTTTMTYSYTTGVLSMTKQSVLNENQRQAMKAHHISATCQSAFKPFLKPYGLNVEHLYLDAETNRTVYKVIITDKDC